MHRAETSIQLSATQGAFVLLALIAISGCAVSPSGGSPAAPSSHTVSAVRLEVPVESDSLLDRTSVGTGFMLSPRVGVTAAHVFNRRLVNQPLQAEIAGRVFAIELVGQDRSFDVAVFRLTQSEAPGTVLSHARRMPEPGEQVVVAGFPLPDVVLDHQPSLTGGIVSAVDRRIELDGERHDGLIQLDAVASYGNSGGPVMNAGGQVIGMLVLAASGPQGEWRGAAFALPIERVAAIANEILGRAGPGGRAVLE